MAPDGWIQHLLTLALERAMGYRFCDDNLAGFSPPIQRA